MTENESTESSKPWSSLDGYRLMSIDTDPASNVALVIYNLSQKEQPGRPKNSPPIEIVAVIPVTFHGTGPKGWLVLTYDPLLDPRFER